LAAPRNWVQKKGAKRRCFNNENWLVWGVDSLAFMGKPLFKVGRVAEALAHRENLVDNYTICNHVAGNFWESINKGYP
jgi:hypothetical protein